MFEETIEDDIRIVTLKNGKTNPFNKEMLLRLKEIVDEVNASPTAKGIILTGDGRFFSYFFSAAALQSPKNSRLNCTE